MSERLVLIIEARCPEEAQAFARKWAAAEGGLTLRTICSVHSAPRPEALSEGAAWHDKWAVELAVVFAPAVVHG